MMTAPLGHGTQPRPPPTVLQHPGAALSARDTERPNTWLELL